MNTHTEDDDQARRGAKLLGSLQKRKKHSDHFVEIGFSPEDAETLGTVAREVETDTHGDALPEQLRFVTKAEFSAALRAKTPDALAPELREKLTNLATKFRTWLNSMEE